MLHQFRPCLVNYCVYFRTNDLYLLLKPAAEQVKDEIFDHLLRVLITRSKRQRVGELLGRKIRKTGMRDTHAGVAMYLPYSASFYYY